MEAAEDGQFVPLARQTCWPFTKRLGPDAELKLKVPVDVPFPNTNELMTAFVPAKFVAKRFVEVVFVPVALVQMRFEDVSDPTVAFVEINVGALSVVTVPLVARKFVPVAEVKARELMELFVTNKCVAVAFAIVRFVPCALV